MSCNTRIVRLEGEVLHFLRTVPPFFKSGFLFKAASFGLHVFVSELRLIVADQRPGTADLACRRLVTDQTR